MIYRKLRPDETTIQAGDVIAAAFHPRAVGEPAQTHLGGSAAIILRPIPDEPEDVVRIEGEVRDAFTLHGVGEQVSVLVGPDSVPFRLKRGQRVTLLIPRPDPPMPKCPYCGMELTIKRNDEGYRAECSYSNCRIVVRGNACRTRREAIEAMTQKGGGQ